jgi:ATP-dependent DNA helicase RecG
MPDGTFDLQPITEAPIEALNLRWFEDYREQSIDPETLASNHRSTEEKLASLRCYDLRARAPTVAGVLLFGHHARHYLPGAYVQFLRFPSNTMNERPIDELEIAGDLRTVAEMLKQKVIAHNRVALLQGEGFRDKPQPTYPEWALRKLLHNALIHRDYQSTAPVRFYWFEDHIDIQSPGGLYGGVTLQSLTRENSYRNPILAEAMKTLRYVNRYGYGIQRAQQLLADNGNPPIEFGVTDRYFLAKLKPA